MFHSFGTISFQTEICKSSPCFQGGRWYCSKQLYTCFPHPILIEFLKNWCTNDLNLILVNLTFLKPFASTVFVADMLHIMQLWILLAPSKIRWITNYYHVAFLLILKKLLSLWTTFKQAGTIWYKRSYQQLVFVLLTISCTDNFCWVIYFKYT